MILTQQLSELVEDVYDDMSNGQVGTSTTLFVKTQTGLLSPVTSTNIVLSNKTFSNSQVTVNHTINVSTGNTATFAEFEVNNGVESYNRSVKASFLKDLNIEATVVHTFDFEILT
jgi:hypothetical protein